MENLDIPKSFASQFTVIAFKVYDTVETLRITLKVFLPTLWDPQTTITDEQAQEDGVDLLDMIRLAIEELIDGIQTQRQMISDPSISLSVIK